MKTLFTKKSAKGYVENIILFSIAPIVYLPFLYNDIITNRKRYHLFIALSVGLVSFLFIPSPSDDKTKYILMYENFKNYDLNSFIGYLKSTYRPDFILHLILFAFAKLSIGSAYFFLLITSYTVYTWFAVSLHQNRLYSDNKIKPIHFFLLIVLSFSLPDLFSGIKFYFANATLLWGYIKINKSPLVGILLLILATLTHFSVAALSIIIIFHSFYPNAKIYKWLFIVSFPFLLIPKEKLSKLIYLINPSELYQAKANIYLSNTDLLSRGLETGSANYIYVVLASTLWIYFAYAYLLLTMNKSCKIRNLIYLLLFFTNLTYSTPTVFVRYLITIKIFFSIMLLSDYQVQEKKLSTLNFFIALYCISFFAQIIILRHNLNESLLNTENILITTMLNSR